MAEAGEERTERWVKLMSKALHIAVSRYSIDVLPMPADVNSGITSDCKHDEHGKGTEQSKSHGA